MSKLVHTTLLFDENSVGEYTAKHAATRTNRPLGAFKRFYIFKYICKCISWQISNENVGNQDFYRNKDDFSFIK